MNKNRLIEEHLGLVYHMIHTYYPGFIGDEDLVAEGFLALCNAAKVYDESKGKFSTYACTVILNQFRTYFRTKMKQIPTTSLDYEVKDSDGHNTTRHELIADDDSFKPFDMVEREMFVDDLSDIEQTVVDLILDGCTQSEVAEKLGMSQPTVYRLLRKIKRQWRNADGEN